MNGNLIGWTGTRLDDDSDWWGLYSADGEDDWDDELECELCGEAIAEGQRAADMALPDGRVMMCHRQCGEDAGGEVA